MLIRKYKETGRSGFTLAELLVVVAIIAILVAVSIPIFTSKLEEARVNTDIANERAAKAAAISDYMQSDQPEMYSRYYDAQNGSMVEINENTSMPKGYNQTNRTTGLNKKNNGVIIVNITSENGKLNINIGWVIVDKLAG